MGLPLVLYRTLRKIFVRRSTFTSEHLPNKTRRTGPLIWLHAPLARDRAVVREMIVEFSDRNPDLWFLVTTDSAEEFDWPDQCFQQIVPPENIHHVNAFLDYWQPDVASWLSGKLRPELIEQTARRDISVFLLDTGNAFEAAKSLRFRPGLTNDTLGAFRLALVGDAATQDALISAGMPSERIKMAGVLERGEDALLCNEAERDTLAELLDTRPVWLAAGINIAEVESVLAAHQQALRRSHRLLLIIVPDRPDDADDFAEALSERGVVVARRSAGEEPEADTQIYLADADGELGLWYRLAPTSFIGQTLAGRSGVGPNPFDAAALGSVVLHGPGLEPHQNAFHRLGRAGASQQVTHSGELALAVEYLLAPDKAAEMAHAAWKISTAGAEVLEHVIELMNEALDGPGDLQ